MEQEILAKLNKLRAEANRYVELAKSYENDGLYDKMSECYEKAANLESKFLTTQIEYYRDKKYFILNAAPKNTANRTVNVIIELLDIDTEERINFSNLSKCPPYVKLGSMYPIFLREKKFPFGFDEVTYPVLDKKGLRRVSSLNEVEPKTFVFIENLFSIDDNAAYPIGAMGAQLICSPEVLRMFGWWS